MKHSNHKEFNFGGDQGLYVNQNGQLIEPLFGQEVRGVGQAMAPTFLNELFLEEWEDEDFSLLS